MAVDALRSRIGREIFILASLIAGLPLLGIGAIALFEINRAFDERSTDYLADVAQSYGRSVFERLEHVASLLSTLDTDELVALATPQIEAIARIDRQGNVTLDFPSLSESLIEQARNVRAPALTFERSGMSVATAMLLPDASGTSIAIVAPAFLWGEPSDYPYAVDFCAIAADAPAPVFCSTKMPADALTAIRENAARADSVTWIGGDTEVRSSYWELFVPSAFDGPLLRLVASQPTAIAEAPWKALRAIYLPAIFITLGLVLLAASAYVRRILTPIQVLRDTTGRIANGELDARAVIDRRDEFRELADATNAMAADLGRQFAALKMFAATDRLILSGSSVDTIADVILSRLTDLLRCRAATIVQLDPDAQDSALVHAKLSDAEQVIVERVALDEEARQMLSACPAGTRRVSADIVPGRFVVGSYTGQDALMRPVFAGGNVRAVVAVIPDGTIELDKPEIELIAELSDRLAIGLELARRQQELIRRATFDSLTGLPNRHLLLDRLEQELIRARSDGHEVSVCFIDLDRFKQVNDSYGHAFGDELLCYTAERLRRCVGETETVARLGGDEFVILVADTKAGLSADVVAERVLTSLSRPFNIEGKEAFVSASVGIARFPKDGETPEGLLRRADTAMYGAKAAGRGQALDFHGELEERVRKKVALEADLRHSIERNEFELHYQPQYRLSDRRLVSAEALLRWVHPTRGVVSPLDFIPAAEESGFMPVLGAWVMSNACRQIRRWRDKGAPIERIAVNVSSQQFQHPDFPAQVTACIEAAGIDPAWLELELTESIFIGDIDDAKARLTELRLLGVSVAIDDFGTGYSSLGYMKELPIDIVKIDRSFIEDLPQNRDACAIVGAIAIMAQTLELTVVAEGIETPVQLNYLRDLHVAIGQGHLLGLPMSADDLLELARAGQAPLHAAGA